MGRVSAERTIPYIVSTGGGPGLMEAANRGASRVYGGVSAGVSGLLIRNLHTFTVWLIFACSISGRYFFAF